MDEIQQQLKDIVANDVELAIERLLDILLPDSKVYQKMVLQKSQYRRVKTEWLIDKIIRDDEARLVFNQISSALLMLIDDLQPSDLKANEQKQDKKATEPLHDYHIYTCDRVDQSDNFQRFFSEKKGSKSHFFYLYGLDLQSHQGMFRRIAYDLEGRLQDYLNPGLQSGRKAHQIELTFDVSRDQEIYKQNILKNLVAALNIRVNDHDPLLEKNLAWLYRESPVLQNLKGEDFVCVFVSIGQYDWDKEITPEVARWFITNFFECETPADCPTFMVFFAIIYEDDNSPIEAELKKVISESQHVRALPELDMVNMGHIGGWFHKYFSKTVSPIDLKTLRSKTFSDKPEYYMSEVEQRLAQLIDEFNNGFFR